MLCPRGSPKLVLWDENLEKIIKQGMVIGTADNNRQRSLGQVAGTWISQRSGESAGYLVRQSSVVCCALSI